MQVIDDDDPQVANWERIVQSYWHQLVRGHYQVTYQNGELANPKDPDDNRSAVVCLCSTHKMTIWRFT